MENFTRSVGKSLIHQGLPAGLIIFGISNMEPKLLLSVYRGDSRLMVYRSIKYLAFLLTIITLLSGSALANATARASVKPEAGTLALLGTGLIGLATLVRRHFSN